ncbi:MAG TPA: hypothetical protein ENK43_04950 [Planctomycetes bacterium]|nr:hypothetical protein [Planctomycetota bacterium]
MQSTTLYIFGLALMIFSFPGCDRSAESENETEAHAPVQVEVGGVFADLERFRCLACHRPTSAAGPLSPTPAPRLEGVGRRLRGGWIADWLAGESPRPRGRVMPYVFRGWPQDEKRQAVADLVAFLLRDGEGPFKDAQTVLTSDTWVGRRLFDGVGCAVCHSREDLGDLSAKTDFPSLQAFLLDPLDLHPDGRMPSLGLSPSEARSIALYLLAPQSTLTSGTRHDGLLLEMLEADGGFLEFDAGLSAGHVVGTRSVTRFSVGDRSRDDRFGLRYRGLITLPESGAWTFSTRSDDGSWLWIDGDLVVRNGGLHGPSTQKGTVVLEEGPHAFQVAMYEHEGGELLEVRCETPSGERLEIAPQWLSHREVALSIPDRSRRPVPGDSARGSVLYSRLGCAACHEKSPRQGLAAPTLAEIRNPDGGCLDPDPNTRAPGFDLTRAERSRLRTWLAGADRERVLKVSDEVMLSSRLLHLGCLGCHERNGRGGPVGEERSRFQGTADLGDEGSLPPRLTGVGAKLTKSRLRAVLERGATLRPFMKTRMPQFGRANVESIPDLFAALDGNRLEPVEPPGPATPGVLEAGRRLVGRRGFNCITCHRFKGVGDPRNHTVDLVGTTKRIRFPWFRRLLTHPAELNPGTRMPPYWSGGTVDFPDVLGGDREAQIAAIWQYLDGAEQWPAPHGLDYDVAAYDLTPVGRPIYFGAFFRGVGPKTLCVGFPEDVSIAYDMARARLAKVWKGAFVNAAGTWTDRGGKLEVPDSLDVIDLPPAPTAAILDSPEAIWPDDEGHRGTWAFRGHDRDQDGRPTFISSRNEMEIRETISPLGGDDRRGIRRRFVVTAPLRRQLEFRLTRGTSLRPGPDGFLAGRVLVRTRGGKARVVNVDGESELRVTVTALPDGATLEVDYLW